MNADCEGELSDFQAERELERQGVVTAVRETAKLIRPWEGLWDRHRGDLIENMGDEGENRGVFCHTMSDPTATATWQRDYSHKRIEAPKNLPTAVGAAKWL